jgi:hypothetical protein
MDNVDPSRPRRTGHQPEITLHQRYEYRHLGTYCPSAAFLMAHQFGRGQTPSTARRMLPWPRGHPAPPLSGVHIRYAFFFRRDVPSVTPCLEAC